MQTRSQGIANIGEGLARGSRQLLFLATLVGLWTFGVYIMLRAGGATVRNFVQWQGLLGNEPLETARDWIANLGIALHFFMGMVLVLTWPILFSARIRRQRPAVHRWTGRLYVSAAGLAGAGGLAFIVTHGALDLYQNIAFGLWGSLMAATALMTYLRARARKIAAHREWAIRLFALVLGSWLFDLEYRAWIDLTGGVGIGETSRGWFDYAADYLFFVPNLAVAEYYIRRKRGQIRPWVQKLTAATLCAGALLLCYAFWATSISPKGKFGKHLASVVAPPAP